MPEEKLILYTKTGEEVVTLSVGSSLTVHFMDPRPEVLIWRSRVFTWSDSNQRYEEGLAFTVFTGEELKNIAKFNL